MTKRLAALLLSLLLLSACAPTPPAPTEMETERSAPSTDELSPGAEESYVVSMDTTAPPTMPEEDDGPVWYPPGLHADFMGEKNRENMDENGVYHHPYTGGEMRIDCRLSYCDPMDTEIALYLFVDGMLQPFRLEEGGELAYVHTVEARSTVELVFLYFTPVTGQAGDALRVQLCAHPTPAYILGLEMLTELEEVLCDPVSCTTRIKLEADPPAETETVPAPEKYLLSWSSDTVDLSEGERSQLSRESEVMDLMLNGDGIELLYNVTPEDSVELRLEYYTDLEGAQYSLLFLLDGQPVSVDPADWMTFETKTGQKNVVTARLSLRDFENVGKIGVLCICRNRSQPLNAALYREVYLTAASGYSTHVELVKNSR